MEQHSKHAGHGSYAMLALEMAIDFVIMYLVMYTMIATLEGVYLTNI